MTDIQQVREALMHGFHNTLTERSKQYEKALAALSRLEAAAAAEYERGRQDGMKQEHALWKLAQAGQEIEAAADHVPDAGKMVPELSREDAAKTKRKVTYTCPACAFSLERTE